VKDIWRNLLTNRNLFQRLIFKRLYKCLKSIRNLFLWNIKIFDYNSKNIMNSLIQLSFSKKNAHTIFTQYWFMTVCKLNLAIIIPSYSTEWVKIGWDSMITMCQLRQSRMYLMKHLAVTSRKMANALILWFMLIRKLKMRFKKLHYTNTAKKIL
jgi:hypothetical protein